MHVLNGDQWRSAAGETPPGKPPTARDYTEAGLPWFDWYDESATALAGSRRLAALDSVAAKTVKLGQPPLLDNDAAVPTHVVPLGPDAAHVTDGEW